LTKNAIQEYHLKLPYPQALKKTQRCFQYFQPKFSFENSKLDKVVEKWGGWLLKAFLTASNEGHHGAASILHP
jgi:hypothetical protein